MKKNIRFGILAIALVFAMVLPVAGCGVLSGSARPRNIDDLALDMETPPPEALAAGGINETQYNRLKDAADGYIGWFFDKEGLNLMWSDRTQNDFNAVRTEISAIKGSASRGSGFEGGIHWAKGSRWELALFTARHTEDGFTFPARTMFLILDK